MNIQKITDKLNNSKWLMEKRSLYTFCDIVHRLHNLKTLPDYLPMVSKKKEQANVPITANSSPENGDVSLIHVSGILTKGASEEESELLGLQDIDEISNALDEAANDPTVRCIVMCFDSPGGETTGIEELGRKMRDIDENIKEIYVWTETHMASAAYWLGSQASTIGMAPSAQVGSIGVYMMVLDASKKYENEGVNVQAISSGEWKLMGHDHRALNEKEKGYLQKDVETQHNKFKNVILSKRPDVNLEALDGLSYEGQDALNNGLVDIVCDNFDDFLTQVLYVL